MKSGQCNMTVKKKYKIGEIDLYLLREHHKAVDANVISDGNAT